MNYCKVIHKFYAPASHRRGIVINQQWFMQDGTTAHTGNATLEQLTQKFVDRLTSQKMDNPWASYSPDLNYCEFFL